MSNLTMSNLTLLADPDDLLDCLVLAAYKVHQETESNFQPDSAFFDLVWEAASRLEFQIGSRKVVEPLLREIIEANTVARVEDSFFSWHNGELGLTEEGELYVEGGATHRQWWEGVESWLLPADKLESLREQARLVKPPPFLHDKLTLDACFTRLASMNPEEYRALAALIQDIQAFAGGDLDAVVYESSLDQYIEEAMTRTWLEDFQASPEGLERVHELTEALLCKEFYPRAKGVFEAGCWLDAPKQADSTSRS